MIINNYQFSGDTPLPFHKRLWWDFLNYADTFDSFSNTCNTPQIYDFNVSKFEFDDYFLRADMSPSRLLCNLFTTSFAENPILDSLSDIRILDCACGDGSYLGLFKNIFSTKLSEYHGFDVAEHGNWTAQKNKRNSFDIAFDTANAHFVPLDWIARSNFIFSQSAIEHFENDIKFFECIKEGNIKQKKPVVQLHLFPGPEAWRKTGPHGYRGYSLKHIDRIRQVFKGWKVHTVRLGNGKVNKVHYKYIHDEIKKFLLMGAKLDKRKLLLEEYSQELQKVLTAENNAQNHLRNASFVALVITNFDYTGIPSFSYPPR